MYKLFIILLTLSTFSSFLVAQEETDSIEVYLIDAYCKPDLPHPFILSFFTSLPTKTKVILEDKYEFDVSTEFTDLHNAQIDVSKLFFLDKQVNFIIEGEDSLGNQFKSEVFDFDLPYEPQITGGSSLLTLCLFGGVVFLLPAPGYINQDGKEFFSLSKELPLISFRSKSFNYPASYISIEYTYIFNAEYRKFFRAGYKRLFEIPVFEYLSPGISAYTNFSSQNGISPEISVGWFKIYDTFTVYTRYRYNIKPSDSNSNFHELYLGLYSGFFSFYL